MIGSLDVTKLLEFYVRLLYGGMMKISNVGGTKYLKLVNVHLLPWYS